MISGHTYFKIYSIYIKIKKNNILYLNKGARSASYTVLVCFSVYFNLHTGECLGRYLL